MAFRFALATVLHVRILREEQEEGILQQILLEIAHTRRSALSLAVQIQQFNNDSTRVQNHETLGRTLHLRNKDIEQLKHYKAELEVELEKLELLREIQLARYQAARQSRELLGNMRDRQHTAYLTDMDKREQRTLDDSYLMRRKIN